MKNQTYTIDATGKSLGRVASEAATLLRGKGEATFERHIAPDVKVVITNASKVKIMQKKLTEKVYDWYSGYPGGRTEETMGSMIKRKGVGEVFRRAVKGMLPNNRLKSPIMKHLTVEE